MPILKVLLLGPPEIRWEDKKIQISRRIPRALLFYLAQNAGLVTRDEIMSLFWPETSASAARLRLNENLSRLRASLPDPKRILRNGNLIGLDPRRIYVDTQVFDELINRVGQAPWQIPKDQPLPPHLLQGLQSALVLWRSTSFMSGNTFPSTTELDRWRVDTGEHYERLRVRILKRLAAHAYAMGNPEAALEHAKEALSTDELDTDLHQQVMQCLIDQDHLHQARDYFHHAQSILQQELGIDPPQNLVSLFKSIQFLRDSQSPHSIPGWMLHPSMKVPFVGRQKTRLQLRHLYTQQKNLMLLGEAGSGKTRLIQEFVDQIHPPPRLLVATCKPIETSLPFQPISEMFRRCLTDEEWLALPQVWARQLFRLLPELQHKRPNLEPPTMPIDPLQAQAVILEAIRQVFLYLSQKQGIIMILDDAQWADEATLDTLLYLHPRVPFAENAFLTILARQEEMSPNLERVYTSMCQFKQAEALPLRGLTAKDVSELTRFILKKTPSEEFVENLLTGTGGNSFFVLEILRTILETSPEPDVSRMVEMPLSRNIYNLIQTRVSVLDPDSRRILETAAAIGSVFGLRMLIQICQQPEGAVIQAVDDLEKRLIIHPVLTTSGRTRYHFNHDIIREVLLENLSPARATLIHERVAEFMVEEYRPEEAVILAQHYQAAGKLVEAYRYWVAAGDRARSLLAHQDARRAISQAQKLIQEIESQLTDDELYHLYATWGEMSYEINDTRQIRSCGRSLLQLGHKRQSALLIGTALDTLSDACMTENNFEEGLAYVNQAIPYLEQTEYIYQQMEAYIHRGVFLYMLNNLDDAITAFENSLALGADNFTPEVNQARSNAHFQLSLLQTLKGWPVRGRYHAILSLDNAAASQRAYLQTGGYFVLTLSSYYLSEFHRAQKYAQDGIDLAERSQGWRMLGYLSGYGAATNLTLGKVDTALAMARKTIHLGEKFELNDVIAMGCRHLGDVFTLLNAPQKAIPYYERGAEIAGNHFLGVDNLIRMGFTRCISGEIEKGHQTLALALTATQNTNLDLGVIITEHFQSLAYLFQNEWQKAGQLAKKVKQKTHLHSLPAYHFGAILVLARLALNNGDVDQAVDQIKTVAAKARLVGNLWLELSAQIQLGKIHDQMGRQDPLVKKRIRHLLDILRDNTKDPQIRSTFLAFAHFLDPPL